MNSLIVTSFAISFIIHSSNTFTLVNETEVTSSSKTNVSNQVILLPSTHDNLSHLPVNSTDLSVNESNEPVKSFTTLHPVTSDQVRVNERESPLRQGKDVRERKSRENDVIIADEQSKGKLYINQGKHLSNSKTSHLNTVNQLNEIAKAIKENESIVVSTHINLQEGQNVKPDEAMSSTIQSMNQSSEMNAIIHETTGMTTSSHSDEPCIHRAQSNSQSNLSSLKVNISTHHTFSSSLPLQSSSSVIQSNVTDRKHTVKARKGVKEYPLEMTNLTSHDDNVSINSIDGTHPLDSMYKSSDPPEVRLVHHSPSSSFTSSDTMNLSPLDTSIVNVQSKNESTTASSSIVTGMNAHDSHENDRESLVTSQIDSNDMDQHKSSSHLKLDKISSSVNHVFISTGVPKPSSFIVNVSNHMSTGNLQLEAVTDASSVRSTHRPSEKNRLSSRM